MVVCGITGNLDIKMQEEESSEHMVNSVLTKRTCMTEKACSDSVLLLGFNAAVVQDASLTVSSAVMDNRHLLLCLIL